MRFDPEVPVISEENNGEGGGARGGEFVVKTERGLEDEIIIGGLGGRGGPTHHGSLGEGGGGGGGGRHTLPVSSAVKERDWSRLPRVVRICRVGPITCRM